MVTRKRTTIEVFAAIVVIAGAPTVTAPALMRQPSPLASAPTSAMQKNSAAAPTLTPTSRVPVYSPALNAVFAGTGSLIEVTVAVCAPAALVTVMVYSMIASGIALGLVNRLTGSQTTALPLATDNAADATTKVFCAFAVLLETTICSVLATSTPASLTHAALVSGFIAVTSSCTMAVL